MLENVKNIYWENIFQNFNQSSILIKVKAKFYSYLNKKFW